MSATVQCPHSDLHIAVNHVAFGDTNVHYLEIRARCKVCDRPVVFRGVPLGLSPHHPTGELGGYEVRLPFLVEGEEPTGKLLGFTGKRTL